MDKYEVIEKVGEGGFGTVYKAKHRETGEIVALKNILLNKSEGVAGSLLREISILKELKHENVIKLYDIIHKETKMILVFEFLEQDMLNYITMHSDMIDPATTRSLMIQLMKGLAFCHSKKILHRDLKPENLLISKNGELKIADFGMARSLGVSFRNVSSDVGTLWYRPPDVLFGAPKHTATIDIWSAGCIFAEISNKGVPLFPGGDVNDQLIRIFRLLGTPTNHSWPGVQNLPKYKSFPTYPSNPNWASLFPNMTQAGHDLISKLLVCNPTERLTADAALKHPYFMNSV